MKSKICIVQANYYPDISTKLFKGATNELIKRGLIDKELKEFLEPKWTVPGIFEIPIVIANNIKSYDAFIALGCVIKGKTPHFEIISKATINAIMDLSIKFRKPIGNGIITCLNKKQALERAEITKKNKGGEAASAVLSVLGILKDESK
jgi:6,7-dimethyl-8-ribityllumazine synthase